MNVAKTPLKSILMCPAVILLCNNLFCKLVYFILVVLKNDSFILCQSTVSSSILPSFLSLALYRVSCTKVFINCASVLAWQDSLAGPHLAALLKQSWAACRMSEHLAPSPTHPLLSLSPFCMFSILSSPPPPLYSPSLSLPVRGLSLTLYPSAFLSVNVSSRSSSCLYNSVCCTQAVLSPAFLRLLSPPRGR